jgi:hypothetical protein
MFGCGPRDSFVITYVRGTVARIVGREELHRQLVFSS